MVVLADRSVVSQLRAGVHGVAVGADLVLLDEQADAYVCLPGGASLVIVDEGQVVGVRPDAVESLAEAGLIGQGDGAVRRPPSPPSRSVDLWGRSRRDGAALLRLASAGLAAARDYRVLSLGRLLARARSGAMPGARRMTPSLEAACGQYAAMRPWAPFGGACLQRSYMMLDYLRRLGFDADWVIGVRTWPFAAHCWLQVEEVALDDDHERLAAYTPLMVV